MVFRLTGSGNGDGRGERGREANVSREGEDGNRAVTVVRSTLRRN